MSNANRCLSRTESDLAQAEAEISRLESQRAELVAALRGAVDAWGDYVPNPNSNSGKALATARAALKKAGLL